MHKDIKEILVTKESIENRVKELGEKISNDYNSADEIVMIGVLKGANMFLGDLIRQINLPVKIDFIAVSSYGLSTESTGVVKILKDLDIDIEGKHVIIVEDIIDTGLTLKYISENLKTRNASTIKICTLLDKPARRQCQIPVEYVGFEIPDEFIVGYGIDYAEKYRNLPYVGTLKEDTYRK